MKLIKLNTGVALLSLLAITGFAQVTFAGAWKTIAKIEETTIEGSTEEGIVSSMLLTTDNLLNCDFRTFLEEKNIILFPSQIMAKAEFGRIEFIQQRGQYITEPEIHRIDIEKGKITYWNYGRETLNKSIELQMRCQ